MHSRGGPASWFGVQVGARNAGLEGRWEVGGLGLTFVRGSQGVIFRPAAGPARAGRVGKRAAGSAHRVRQDAVAPVLRAGMAAEAEDGDAGGGGCREGTQ